FAHDVARRTVGVEQPPVGDFERRLLFTHWFHTVGATDACGARRRPTTRLISTVWLTPAMVAPAATHPQESLKSKVQSSKSKVQRLLSKTMPPFGAHSFRL